MSFSPSEDDFEYLIKIIRSKPSKLKHAIGSYGDEMLHIGPDERLLTEAFQVNKKQTSSVIPFQSLYLVYHVPKVETICRCLTGDVDKRHFFLRLTHFISDLQKKYGWTHIHPRFCATAWHLSKLRSNEVPVILHFVSKKPWEYKGEYFKDFDFW